MMPQITVSNPLFAQLQSLGEAFVDTPETVIQRLVDHYMASSATGVTTHDPILTAPLELKEGEYMKFPPNAAPNLSFTRPLSIELDGVKFQKGQLYWNPLLFELVRLASVKVKDKDALKEMLLCNYADGKGPEGKGYRYIPEGDISVQGQAANPAWRSILHLAQKLGLTIDVVFRWDDEPKAQFPNKTARMMFSGS